MDSTFAYDIIEKLALGIDPVTGAPLHNESALNQAVVIRALFMAKEALIAAGAAPGQQLRAHAGKVAEPGAPNDKVGKKWLDGDRAELLCMFQEAVPITQIAERLGRSTGGIIARLVHEKVLTDRDEGRALMRRQAAENADSGALFNT
jgi:hypothetical protein